jgi:hypothetical protein
MLKRTKKSTTRVLALLTAALQRLRLQLVVRVHLRPDEQVSETFVFVILQREKANKVFGKGFFTRLLPKLRHDSSSNKIQGRYVPASSSSG